ncbi:hypothetical protein PNF54_003555 [Cronobacter sakazakii]|nr:hypothetical protein [Cronobacter sakazakii]ELY6004922.1 hypothetical protein [Cronobacter sakazakii]
MSTISNERVEFYATTKPPFGYTGSDINTMARELLALRKERGRAEPVEHESHIRREVNVGGNTWVQCSTQAFEREKARGAICRVLYESPPAPVVPAAYEIDSNATDYHRGWNACRATMLQSGNDEIGSWSNHKTTPTDKPKSETSQQAEQLLRDTTALAATLSSETDTTPQQFESLAGKAVVPAGWKLVPVELTKEMLKQIHPFAEATCLDCGRQVVADCVDNVTASWNDMLAVAPEPCK